MLLRPAANARKAATLFLLPALLSVLALPRIASAQATADIVGTVTDSSGAALSGANVTITNAGTDFTRSVKTGPQGDYAFTEVPIGTYKVVIEAGGFKSYEAPSLTIASGDRARIDAAMQVGDVHQTVEVEAQAPVLQTDSSSVGALVTTQAVQNLPVNGRNSIVLVQITAGANEGPQSSFSSGSRPDDRRQTSTVSANGQPDSNNNYMLDGLDNNERMIATIVVKPSIDALQEVRVDTNMYSAEVGRNSGAVVNMLTKAGTNNFHGTAYEFLRNDLFDAKNFFNVPQTGNPLAGVKPEYRQNQFGGSIGGPIIKDKTFFFADYEALRIIQGTTFTATVPTACELGQAACNGVTQLGNFSDTSTPIYNPTTHQQYPGNIIPVAQVNPIAANYAALFPSLPASACSGITCNFVNSPKRTQYAHTADARIDQHFNERDLLYGRYSINNTDTFTPGALPIVNVAGLKVNPAGPTTSAFAGPAYQRQQSVSISEVHLFAPNLVLQTGIQLARFVTESLPGNYGVNVNSAFGGPGNVNTAVPGTSGLALVTFQTGGYSTLGDSFALPTDYWDTNLQYAGNLTWTRGAHTLKFGASVLRRDWSTFQSLFKGEFVFNAQETNSADSPVGSGGNAFASLLAGYPHQEVRNTSLIAPQYRDWEVAEYVQDDWRVTKWLTVNLGLRYDIFTPFHEKHNDLSNFDPTNPSELAGGQILVAGANGVSPSVNIPTQYRDIQPRFGFAATVAKNLVVRGGFGISYYPDNIASPAALKNAPFQSSLTLNQGVNGTNLYNFSNPLPYPAALPTCISAGCGATGGPYSISAATVSNFKYEGVYMENLIVEKQFGSNVISAGYVGEIGRHVGRVVTNADLALPPLQGGCGTTKAIVLPNPCQIYYGSIPLVNSIQLLESNGNTSYNAFQAQFQRRYSAGLTIGANYTHAKSLADVGGAGAACSGCTLVLNNFHYDYGPSDYDVKNRVAVSVNYQIPYGKSLTGFLGQVVKGWEVNGIYTYSSGLPFTVLDGTPRINNGASSDRPDSLAQGAFTQNLNEWLNYTDFVQQPLGTIGTEGRNQFFSPSIKHFDFSTFKDFPIRESMKLQFRAEFFNFTNTPSFAPPGATISQWANGVPTQAGNFGKITATNALYTPRDIQFALKFLF